MNLHGVSGFLMSAPRAASSVEKKAAENSSEQPPAHKADPQSGPRDPALTEPKPVEEDPGYGIEGPGSGGGYIRTNQGKSASLDPQDRVELSRDKE